MIKTGIPHASLLFIDIETITAAHKIYDLPVTLAVAWQYICETRYKDEKDEKGNPLDPGLLFQKYAALYPEFGKICCISLGHFTNQTDFVVQAFCDVNERKLLCAVSDEITKLSSSHKVLAGHNLKQFDVPFLIRRSTITGAVLPTLFDIYGKKPWDLDSVFVDTRDMWASCAFNLGSCSLESISAAFGFKSPKEEMHGDMVTTIYYMPAGPDFTKIGQYCNRDVISCCGIYLQMTKGKVEMKIAENKY